MRCASVQPWANPGDAGGNASRLPAAGNGGGIYLSTIDHNPLPGGPAASEPEASAMGSAQSPSLTSVVAGSGDRATTAAVEAAAQEQKRPRQDCLGRFCSTGARQGRG